VTSPSWGTGTVFASPLGALLHASAKLVRFRNRSFSQVFHARSSYLSRLGRVDHNLFGLEKLGSLIRSHMRNGTSLKRSTTGMIRSFWRRTASGSRYGFEPPRISGDRKSVV